MKVTKYKCLHVLGRATFSFLLVSNGFAQTPGIPPDSGTAAYVDGQSGGTVEALVKSALARNADLLATRQRVAEAQGLLRQAGLYVNPTIQTSYGTGSFLGSKGERQFQASYNHVFQLGGKRERRIEVAQIGAELATLEIAERERQVRGDVRSRFGDALAAIRNLEIVQELLGLTGQTFQITQARVRVGEAAAVEQGLLQVEVNRLESDRRLFDNQVVRALLDIKPLIGMPLDENLRLAGDLRAPEVKFSLEEAFARARRDRPDLRAARLEQTLRDAELRQARAEAVPDVVGTAQYARIDSAFDQLGLGTGGATVPIRDRDNIVTAGISITLPTRNRNQGNIQAASARVAAAKSRLQFVEQTVVRDVRSAYSRYEATRQSLAIYDQNVLNQARDNVRIIRAAYQAGELRLFDVLNEQRRLVDTQRAYTEVLKEYYLSLVDLERAVGAPLN